MLFFPLWEKNSGKGSPFSGHKQRKCHKKVEAIDALG
jgi:hypothetical protein